jgi:hypothetical protein
MDKQRWEAELKEVERKITAAKAEGDLEWLENLYGQQTLCLIRLEQAKQIVPVH